MKNLKKSLIAIFFQTVLWFFWYLGLNVAGDDFSTALADPITYWCLSLIWPLIFGIWLSLLHPKGQPTERYAGRIFPGLSILYWIWIPFIIQLFLLWLLWDAQ